MLSVAVLILIHIVLLLAPGQDVPASAPADKRPAPTSAPAATQPAPTLQSAGELWIEGEYEQAVDQYRALLADPQTALQASIGLARCDLMTGEYLRALNQLDGFADQGDGAADDGQRLVAGLLAGDGCEVLGGRLLLRS